MPAVFSNRCRRTNRTKHPEYSSWKGMISRCYREKDKDFRYYGARGVTVCQRWIDSFEAFLCDMGPRPSSQHSIDRINTFGPYEPINCRWATMDEQNANRRPYPKNRKSPRTNLPGEAA
jgi:hypothetical protein